VQFVSRQLGHTKISARWDTYLHLFDAHGHAQDARDQLEADYDGMLGERVTGEPAWALGEVPPALRAAATGAGTHREPIDKLMAAHGRLRRRG
jgi:hypothetical protein